MNEATRKLIEATFFSIAMSPDPAQTKAIIEHALRTQDRNTRHACAEAIIGLNDGCGSSDVRSALSAAHQACVNALSV